MSPNLSGAPAPTPQEIAEAESRLTDFHYALFDLLPTEGMNVGLRPMVITVNLLVKKLAALEGGTKMSSGTLMAELKVMEKYGLAIRVQKLSGHTLGWQKSARAGELLAARKRRDASDETSDAFEAPARAAAAAAEAEVEAEAYYRPITPDTAEEITRALERGRTGSSAPGSEGGRS